MTFNGMVTELGGDASALPVAASHGLQVVLWVPVGVVDDAGVSLAGREGGREGGKQEGKDSMRQQGGIIARPRSIPHEGMHTECREQSGCGGNRGRRRQPSWPCLSPFPTPTLPLPSSFYRTKWMVDVDQMADKLNDLQVDQLPEWSSE